MKELALNILDIAQNSVSVNATLIEITVDENPSNNLLTLTIKDNGKGMSEDFLEKVTDPFVTTRTTRKVGMGIALLKLAAEQAAGDFRITSALGKGTTVQATFQYDHIDRVPLGNLPQTIASLVSCNEEIDFAYTHLYNGESFVFRTQEIKEALQGVPLHTPDVVIWMQEYLSEGISTICGGVKE